MFLKICKADRFGHRCPLKYRGSIMTSGLIPLNTPGWLARFPPGFSTIFVPGERRSFNATGSIPILKGIIPNCPKTRMVGFSSGFSMIVTQHAPEPLSTVDGSVAWELGEFRANDLVLEPLMIPFHMIMQNEFRDGPTQRRLSD